MPHARAIRIFLSAAAAALTAAGAGVATAQTPPIKPGLWELKTGSVGEAGKPDTARPMPDLSKLPPEARAKVEAMMKEKGIGMTGDGKLRVCLSRESLDRDAWRQAENCKTEYSQRSASVWKWHATCPNSEVDGEAVFESAERYTVKNVVTSQRKGEPRRTEMNARAQWMGADCGDIKPLVPRK